MFIQNIIESIKPVNTIDVFILIFATCISTYIFNFYYKYYTRPNPLPGPFPLPYIGNGLNYGDVKKFYEECQHKYGDICELMLDRRYIILSRPDYVKKLFAPAQFFMRLPNSPGTIELGMCNHGLFFNEDHKSWNFNKRFFTEALSAKFIDASIIPINQILEELCGYLQSLGKQNTSKNNNDDNNWTLETDFSAWFHGFTNDVTSILATGKRTYSIASYYNTLSINKSEHPNALVEDGNNFVKALVKFLESLLFFSFYSPFTRRYVPIFKSKSDSYISNRDYVYDKLDNIVKNRRAEIKEKPETRIRTDMLTSLITAETVVEGEDFRPLTDKEIRMNLLDIFMGGSDTTADTFCFMTYFLCKHPNVKEKMLSEIDSIIPKSSGYLSCIELRKLKYCEAIIKEASRLIPAVPFVFRHTVSEFEIGGYKWPAGTDFHINFEGAHKHPGFWNNPKDFNPERFYKNDDDNDRGAWMPFGGGRRICPGKGLATTELLLLMSSIYKNYNFELVNEHEPLKIHTQIISSCTELKVRISPRT